jgi:hypothetical protein
MRTLAFLSALLLVAAAFAAVPLSAAEDDKEAPKFVPIFNGKNLDGWVAVLGGKEAEAGTTFTVKEGALVISGKPAGYVATKKSFEDYTIKYDWKFVRPAKLEDDEKFGGNSGLLIHIQGPPAKGVWPKCLEVQGMNRQHGQLLNVSGAKGGPYKFDQAALKKARKRVGEWNTTEVTVKGGQVVVKVNGTEVASGKSELTKGPIGFQSEGSELHIKNVAVRQGK